jgi:hypothetical protein
MYALERVAKEADLNKITMPFVYQSTAGKWFFNNIIKKFDTDLTIVMLPSPYKSKYTSVGSIDDRHDKRTCLYAGDDIYSYYIEDDDEAPLRLMDIEENTRQKWLEEKFFYI